MCRSDRLAPTAVPDSDTTRRRGGTHAPDPNDNPSLVTWPEERDPSQWWLPHIYKRWMYTYMGPLLSKGARQSKTDHVSHLSPEDLYPIPESMRSTELSKRFWSLYERHRGSKRQLVLTLWQMVSSIFVPAGFCQLVTVFMQIAMPLLVRQLLTVLSNNPGQNVVRQGMPYAVGIFLTVFVNGLATHRHRHLAMKSGVLMRAAVVEILYEQVLRLTPKGRTGLTSGQVANLVAVDTQKLFEVTQEGHLIWSLPLSISLVTVCLVLIMGPCTLVGIAVLIAFVPVVERITSRMLKIRHARVSWTDKRVAILNGMLQGIKVTKLNNYEANYEKRVSEARAKEVFYLRRELAVWASTLFIMVLSPVLATASTFAVYVLVSEDNILTAATSFSVLLLFAALRFPINYAGRLVGKLAQALSAVNRVNEFLRRETRADLILHGNNNVQSSGSSKIDLTATDEPEAPALKLEQASFMVTSQSNASLVDLEADSSKESSTFTVSGFDFTVCKGEVLAVCGPVGGGKSSLINGIIDEIPKASSSTKVTQRGSIAYVPQTPFILNATIRANILFGRPFDPELYDRVLDACCLRPDLEQLGASADQTEIGERGVTLSGGQKQRVSLARAAYSCPDLVLLDDPLSALDAGTAKEVFSRLIKSPSAFFRSTAVVLVTHAAHFLNRVDSILVVVDGRSKFLGTWDELAVLEPQDDKTQGAINFIRNSVQEENSSYEEIETKENNPMPGNVMEKSRTKTLMTVEEREHGLSSMRTWLLWFNHAGGMSYMGVMVFLMVVDRFAYVATEYWLARWTGGADSPIVVFGITFAPQTDGRSAQYQYLLVYFLILLVSMVFTVLRSEWSVTGGTRASQKVFGSMLSSVLAAPLSYFETTPLGRILNRFTYDIEVMDITLTQNMGIFLISTGWYFTGIFVMISILPYTALAIFPVTLLYAMLLLHYRRTGPDLQRLDAVARSPVQAMVAEGLDGASSIRVFRKEHTFIDKFRAAVDLNSSALLNFVTAQRWLGVRIELLGSIVVLISTALVVSLNERLKLQPGIVGLLIIWSANFTITLGFLIDTFGEAEAAITAIERVDAMANLPKERPMNTESDGAIPSPWPSEGALEFRDVCLRYREGLPLALDHLSFRIPPGKSVGVVGRTGAGKSSLTIALFRLTEIESGNILLDGVELGQLGLSEVRGRKNGMAIIPQDPFLVGSTLRECLDPFGENTDENIIEALTAVRLADPSQGVGVLENRVQEGGVNYSVGERQLLNLARALLSKPSLLVLDEATASIDGETDSFIQRMLRTRFSDTTLITVAHRLNTIMDNDYILVMGAGRAVEFGPPAELLSNGGAFAELVDSTGPDSARALRSMVFSRDDSPTHH